MTEDLLAKASTTVAAPVAKTWHALVDPAAIKQYMFGSTVIADWRTGGSIVWKGEWKGKAYEDKGTILQYEPERTLRYTHFSPLSGLPDTPENYHTVTIQLSAEGDRTHIALVQDNNPTTEARDHSQRNWETMLAGLKKVLEQ